MTKQHDPCPKCGRLKRTKNKQCAACRGYGRKRHIMPSGYVRVYVPDHPVANSDGYALEHRLVLHEAGVHAPRQGWHVHHLNGDRADNRLENLAVMKDSAHIRLHLHETGTVTNQFGTWPILSGEERLARRRELGRLNQARIRARRRALGKSA